MLDKNCLGYRTDGNGRVTGVLLQIIPVKNALYEVKKCRLIDEIESQGRNVAYCKIVPNNGYRTLLCYPPSEDGNYQSRLLPGGDLSNNNHPVVNGYDPAGMGFLAIAVGDKNKNIISDAVTGIGLPFKHHVSFEIEFGLKSSVIDPPKEDNEIKTILLRIENKIDKLLNFIEGDF